MARLAVALLVWLHVATASARSAPVTDEHPKVELVTMGIGALMWERHGHIALCVTQHGLALEPRARRSRRPLLQLRHRRLPAIRSTMAWGFFRGTHSFWVGKDLPWHARHLPLHRSHDLGRSRCRSTRRRRQKVIAKLEYDILDEHRYYAYDHFDDNCTTRIRDIIDNVTDHALAKMTEPTGDETFRDYARDGFFGMTDPARHHRHRDGSLDRSRADVLGADVPAAVPARGGADQVGHQAVP